MICHRSLTRLVRSRAVQCRAGYTHPAYGVTQSRVRILVSSVFTVIITPPIDDLEGGQVSLTDSLGQTHIVSGLTLASESATSH